MATSLFRRTASVGAIALCVGVIAGAAPASAAEADARDFWSSAADAATATIYAPTAAGLRRAGLQRWEGPPQGAGSLSMVCKGEWNVTVGYGTRSGDGRVSILQATPECTGDFGAGDATGTWTFAASGRTFTITYLDCRGTPEGQATPAIDQCTAEDVIYAVDGKLPAAGGKKRTFVHLETLGVTRAQIASLVKSMKVVR